MNDRSRTNSSSEQVNPVLSSAEATVGSGPPAHNTRSRTGRGSAASTGARGTRSSAQRSSSGQNLRRSSRASVPTQRPAGILTGADYDTAFQPRRRAAHHRGTSSGAGTPGAFGGQSVRPGESTSSGEPSGPAPGFISRIRNRFIRGVQAREEVRAQEGSEVESATPPSTTPGSASPEVDPVPILVPPHASTNHPDITEVYNLDTTTQEDIHQQDVQMDQDLSVALVARSSSVPPSRELTGDNAQVPSASFEGPSIAELQQNLLRFSQLQVIQLEHQRQDLAVQTSVVNLESTELARQRDQLIYEYQCERESLVHQIAIRERATREELQLHGRALEEHYEARQRALLETARTEAQQLLATQHQAALERTNALERLLTGARDELNSATEQLSYSTAVHQDLQQQLDQEIDKQRVAERRAAASDATVDQVRRDAERHATTMDNTLAQERAARLAAEQAHRNEFEQRALVETARKQAEAKAKESEDRALALAKELEQATEQRRVAEHAATRAKAGAGQRRQEFLRSARSPSQDDVARRTLDMLASLTNRVEQLDRHLVEVRPVEQAQQGQQAQIEGLRRASRETTPSVFDDSRVDIGNTARGRSLYANARMNPPATVPETLPVATCGQQTLTVHLNNPDAPQSGFPQGETGALREGPDGHLRSSTGQAPPLQWETGSLTASSSLHAPAHSQAHAFRRTPRSVDHSRRAVGERPPCTLR